MCLGRWTSRKIAPNCRLLYTDPNIWLVQPKERGSTRPTDHVYSPLQPWHWCSWSKAGLSQQSCGGTDKISSTVLFPFERARFEQTDSTRNITAEMEEDMLKFKNWCTYRFFTQRDYDYDQATLVNLNEIGAPVGTPPTT